ncbi:DUF4062 domain-containing protein [Variovorax arabinosiphilus]|uniref:DUF4062 domain-containing protein n=1 Tax=Variovorax arabinosiphilus TaxID=3053498 RepID=UPI002575FBEB|nr:MULTISPECIES: DUF4062 domain-containing protein [unclassified Variovorax]MDM0120429.1 DUF4062 domain-containing protein [Variovorax sp. J2L1-78]MDM0127659.1 DUF4062 domain-containing protein [Variovorax sp. J2L1-63]MDM0231358.1 DUF4062 domain-containing protein [Variovorax sp. J2R1-6]
MAGTRRFVKIFLASPGDLIEERKAARVVVDDFNSQLADALGYQVELVGWEDTLPGVGRPQAIINRDLDGCDLFVGMLWKRWGTPPGTEPYTSGFEEEFKRSMTRNAEEGRPEINLLLKELDAASLADPGDHLRKVISFKEQVFAEKKLLAGTFADVRDFEGKFRKCIQGYVIALANQDKSSENEKDQAPLAETQTTPPSEPGPTTPLSVEGARFLRNFLSTAEKATDERPLAATDVARVRLLSIIAAVHGNDQQSMGSHDANLLFKAREKSKFGRRELIGLLDDGLTHLRNENVPLWHWVAAVDGFKENILPICSIVGTTEQRIGALKAMRLISEPIAAKEHLERRQIVSLWFAKPSETAVRVAALEYLSECGQPSDLPSINEEFARNETQTNSAAANAIIRITLRDNRLAALQALYTLQPSTVEQGLINALFSRDAEFDDEVLLRGLSHRNVLVRTTVIKLLKRRRALSVTIVEPMLSDSDAEVRYEALQVLTASGRSYSIEQAKAVLVRKNPAPTGIGLFAMNQVAADGEALLERYTEQFFDSLTISQLEEEQSDIFDQHAYFALIRRDFKLRGDELRSAVANQFVDRFEYLLDEMVKRYGALTDLIEKTRSLGKHLRSKFTREGLDIICSRHDAADLQLVRSMLATGSVDYSAADLLYLAKFGQWCDIPLVIASLDRPEFGRKHVSMLSIARNSKYEDAARTLYALGKHRLNDLLTTTMPGSLLARIVSLMPDKAFQRLDDAVIGSLMRAEIEDVRKAASLKYVRTFPRRRVKQFLEEYMAADQFYYNVIHWLDFGISVPKERMLRAAGKALV